MIDLPKRVAENIDRFTGREWLLPKFLKWWNESDERMFLLTGGPGSGKSMILAWLAGFGRVPEDPSARAQLESVRNPVKAAHFCQAASRNVTPQAFAESIANQLTRSVKGFGDALAATLAERVSIVGTARAGTAEFGSILTGVSIAHLDLGTLGDELSFDRAFTEPLKKLYASGYNEQMLLLVDALDEADTYTGVKIPDLLSRLADLPARIRILASTRDEPRVLKFLRDIKPFDLIKNAEPDVDDVQLYAKGRLVKLTAVDAEKRKDFARRLAEQAGGVFLYAAMVLDVLLERPPTGLPDLDTYPLPDGLGGLYHDFLTRELGKDDKLWFDLYEPLLGLIAVAQGDGLTAQQLTDIIGKDIRATLRACKQYLSGDLPNGPFRPFHKSFADFLLDEKDNVDYHIDSQSRHRRIANYYWSKHRDDWRGCDDGYALTWLSYHLDKADQKQELRGLLLDPQWIRVKLGKCLLADLLSDYRFSDEDTDLKTIQETLQLSAHLLGREPKLLTGQIAGRLISTTSSVLRAFVDSIRETESGQWIELQSQSLTAPGGPLLRTLEGHANAISSVRLAARGRIVLSASQDQTLMLWDLEKGERIRTLGGGQGIIWLAAVSEDGRVAVSKADNGVLQIWDLEQGIAVHTLLGFDSVNSIVVSPNGDRGLLATADSTIKVLDLQSGAEIGSLTGHSGPVNALALTVDGKRLFSAAQDGTLRLWDLDSGTQLKVLHDPPAATDNARRINAVAVSSDCTVAVSTSNLVLKVWDVQRCTEVRTLEGHTFWVSDVALTASGKRAVSSSYDRTVRIWDIKSGRTIRILAGHSDWVRALALTPDGRCAVSGSYDHTLKVWNLERHAVLLPLDKFGKTAITPDGRYALTGASQTFDRTARVWDLQTGSRAHLLEGHPAEVSSVAITPDATRAVCGALSEITFWDLTQRRIIRTIKGHSNNVADLAMSADGRFAISVSGDRNMKLWDVASGSLIWTFGPDSQPVSSLAVTPDWRLAVSSAGGTLRIWDISQRSFVDDAETGAERIATLAINEAGTRIAAGSSDGTLFLWDLERGPSIHILRGHFGGIKNVTMTADGARAASCSYDQTLRLWDLNARRELATFGGDSPLIACAIGSDGSSLVAIETAGYVHRLTLRQGTGKIRIE